MMAGCALMLILALDASASIDSEEYRLQADSTAAALLHPVVRSYIDAQDGPVYVGALSYANSATAIIEPTTDHAAVAAALKRSSEDDARGPLTGIGKAMLTAAGMMQSRQCNRYVLDISGDGAGNTSPHPSAVREDHLSGVQINALLVGSAGAVAAEHYDAHVLQDGPGPGQSGFRMQAETWQDFGMQIIRKLRREIG